MNAALYAQITTALGSAIEDAYDVKLPDYNADGSPWALSKPIVVVFGISDIPTVSIDGRIGYREQRITCEVQAVEIEPARAVKESLIVALQGWTGAGIKSCVLEGGGPELYDAGLNPPRYCLPIDFMIAI